MTKLKEQKDRELLTLEWVIGLFALIFLLGAIAVASTFEMEDWLRVIIIVGGFIIFCIGMYYGLKIEQIAGYYECAECHHKYVPTYSSVFFAMHMGRTRKMRCPKCGKKSWNKKVISKQ